MRDLRPFWKFRSLSWKREDIKKWTIGWNFDLVQNFFSSTNSHSLYIRTCWIIVKWGSHASQNPTQFLSLLTPLCIIDLRLLYLLLYNYVCVHPILIFRKNSIEDTYNTYKCSKINDTVHRYNLFDHYKYIRSIELFDLSPTQWGCTTLSFVKGLWFSPYRKGSHRKGKAEILRYGVYETKG